MAKIRAVPKLKKQLSINEHKKRAWRVFSKWVRTKANGVCFSCGKLVGYSKLDAGHFHGRKSSVLFMDERNVHAQCGGCNRFRGGNLGEYATKLCEVYGANVLLEMAPLRTVVKKWTHEELDEIIRKYTLAEG